MPEARPSLPVPAGAWAVLWVGCAALFLTGLGERGLSSAQEARTGLIARHMLASGDWGLPQLEGDEAWQKPALSYWMVAAVARVRGLDEVSVRLPSALAGLGTLVLVALWGRRRFGAPTAFLATAMLATTFSFHDLARTGRVDMLLTFFVTATLLLLQRARESGPAGSRGWAVLAGASLGLAVLTKGLVGPALVGGALLLPAFARGDPHHFLRSRPLVVAAVATLVALPWFVHVGQRTDGAFLRHFFGVDHVQRALGSGDEDAGGWWYYLPVLPLRLLPWTPLALLALVRPRPAAGTATPSANTPEHEGWREVLGVIVFGLLFLSAVSYKRADYLLPLFPALALALARLVTQRLELPASAPIAGLRAAGAVLVLLAGLAGVGVATIGILHATGRMDPWLDSAAIGRLLHERDRANLRALGSRWPQMTLALAAFFALAFAAIRRLKWGRRWSGLVLLPTAAAALLVAKLLLLDPAMDRTSSYRGFAAVVAAEIGDGRLTSSGLRVHELHYYLGRPPVELSPAALDDDPGPWLLIREKDHAALDDPRRRRWVTVARTEEGFHRPTLLCRQVP